MSGGGKGSPGFGSGNAPGALSPFDIGAANFGMNQADQMMTNRYKQLGLGAQGATPTSPGSFGAGPTALQMDLGQLPSLTGGIAEQFQAVLGEAQTQDLASTSQRAQPSGGKSSGGVGTALSGIGKVAGK